MVKDMLTGIIKEEKQKVSETEDIKDENKEIKIIEETKEEEKKEIDIDDILFG